MAAVVLSDADAVVAAKAPQRQQQCLLLTRLPPELRDLVYSFVFRDTSIIYYNPRYPYVSPRRSGAFFADRHQAAILVTCRQVFLEAHPIYWQQVVVVSNDSLREASNALSPMAKANIRCLKGQHYKAAIFPQKQQQQQQQQQPDIGALLRQFPRLRNFRLKTTARRFRGPRPEWMVDLRRGSKGWEEKIVASVTHGRGGRGVLDWYGFGALAGSRIAFTQQIIIDVDDEEELDIDIDEEDADSDKGIHRGTRHDLVCFINLSTDRILMMRHEDLGPGASRVDLGHRIVAKMK